MMFFQGAMVERIAVCVIGGIALVVGAIVVCGTMIGLFTLGSSLFGDPIGPLAMGALFLFVTGAGLTWVILK